MSISEAQRKKDPHAGPGDSFPLDAEHLASAWDLAGHAANPEKVRANIIAFAKRHNLEEHLPETARAREEASESTKEEAKEEKVTKAFTIDSSWQIGGNTYVEGWLSKHIPGKLDVEKYEVHPNAFDSALEPYMKLNGPLSYKHNLDV